MVEFQVGNMAMRPQPDWSAERPIVKFCYGTQPNTRSSPRRNSGDRFVEIARLFDNALRAGELPGSGAWRMIEHQEEKARCRFALSVPIVARR